jgi:DNA-binding NtrC family response regulator
MEEAILVSGLPSIYADAYGPHSFLRRKCMIKEKGNELKTKIMLIGLNPDINFLTALKQEGYEAIASESPETAWPLVYAFRPHLIIVHLRYPSRSDIATLQECKAMAAGIPIVVATSVPGHETVMEALEEGATSFLSLPIERAKIKQIVDDLVSSDG